MEKIAIGNSGVEASRIGLGTWAIGGWMWGGTDEAEAIAAIRSAVERGVTLIDTAPVYGFGHSEEIVGQALAEGGLRERAVIATKLGLAWKEGKVSRDSSPARIRQEIEDSLRRLQTDRIDLYQVHAFDPLTPLEETFRCLDDAVRAGKILYIGLSNYAGWQIQKAVDLCEFRGWAAPVTLQPQYNLLAREIEWEVVPACESTGLGLLPGSPLGGGWLTGKYDRSSRPEGATRLGENPERGVEAYDRRGSVQRTWDVIETVQEIASARGVSMAQVALAWLIDRPLMSSVILGARTLEQLEDNLGAAGLHLSPEETSRLDAASDPAPADYPYGGPGVEQRTRTL
jgi:aryl-alcohol dehydrogenase-like predicted oxidoreductase